MYSIRPVFRYPLFKVGEVPEGGRLTVDGLGVWVATPFLPHTHEWTSSWLEISLVYSGIPCVDLFIGGATVTGFALRWAHA